MKLHYIDYILVSLQAALLILFVLDVSMLELVSPAYLKGIALVIAILGFVLLIIALLQLNRNLSPFPTPKKNSQLIQNGIYKYIRHPIYTGILLGCFGYSLYVDSSYKILISVLLLLLFIIKSRYEEKKLKQKFKTYSAYMKKTGRFFPKLP